MPVWRSDKPRKGWVKVTCDWCGDSWWTTPSRVTRSKHHFCTQRCCGNWQSQHLRGENSHNWQGKRVSRTCPICGKKFSRRGNPNRPDIYCSVKCAAQIRPRGEAHHNWKGGIGEGRTTKEYKRWRRAVIKRDSHTCQICGCVPSTVVAHHIKSYADYADLRFDVSNGITLCRPCHAKLHAGKLRLIAN